MASAVKCDACASFFEYDNDQNSINGVVFTHFNESGKISKSIDGYELCPECLNKIKNIIKEV